MVLTQLRSLVQIREVAGRVKTFLISEELVKDDVLAVWKCFREPLLDR